MFWSCFNSEWKVEVKWISDKTEVRNEPTGAFKALTTQKRKKIHRAEARAWEANRLLVWIFYVNEKHRLFFASKNH